MSGIFDQVINYAPPSLLKGTVTYKGTWSAATNTPTLINPPDSTTNGHYYVVSAGGTQFSLVFNIGDWIISNGSAWEKVDNTDAVDSVFGRTGAVVGVSTDYSSVGITATAVGASSPSTGAFTTLSATTPLAVASGGTGVASSTGTTNVVLSGSPTITTPVIAQINDANGNETLKLASIASAVNELSIENAATGNPVHIRATGGDASVGLHLAGKGASGYVNVQDSTDATKRIMFNAAGGTTNTRTMLSSTQTVDRTLSLPDATDTLVGKATTDTLTNKTLTSPTLTAPVLGTPASGNLASCTGYVGTSALVTVGALNSGSITSGFGSIDIGTDALTAGAGNFSGAVTSTVAGAGFLASVGGITTVVSSNGGSLIGTTTNHPLGFIINNSVLSGQITATGLNNMPIGATTAAAGSFTTGTFSGVVGIGTTPTLAQLHITSSGGAFGDYQLALTRTAVGSATMRVGGSNEFIIATAGVDRATFTSTGLAVTGALSASASASGYAGAELRLLGGAGTENAISTTATGSPSMLFDHRGTGNTGSWSWRYGTIAASLAMQLTSTGLAVTGTVSSKIAAATNPILLSSGSTSGSEAYGVLTFNNVVTDVGMMGILAGASGDTDIRYAVASTGRHIFRIAGAGLHILTATGASITGTLSCTGALSKGSGSFRIEHPLPSKSATHQLVHSFIEGPKCDLIYRGKVDLVDGKASVNIDTDSTMTEGTFEALCGTVQCFTSNESGWGAIRGKVVGNILTIEAQDAASTDNISWMVIGERKDPHIMDTDWTDENGRPIVEPLKSAKPALESK